MSMNSRRYLAALSVAVTLVIGILIGTVISHGVRAARVMSGAPDAALLPAPSPVELSNSFAKIADAVEPTVVNINIESTVHIARRKFHSQDDTPFGDFFDRFFQFGPQDGPSSDFRQQSLGSGVILDKSGYILTNYHVITQEGEDRPVDRIRVQIHGDDDPKGYDAKIIGTDWWTDLAVIKIKAGRALPAALMGDSDSMRVGDWVLAVGSPFGLDSTVTAGIISAKGRAIEDGPEGQFKRFLQTDAAINPGNSGGPLVNMGGQVIGINTAIATRHGAYDGVGFAIPSATARKVYNSIVSVGTVRRGAIGVTFRNENNPVLLRSFGADHGVVVSSVEPDSPADHAGLKLGDVIVSAEGMPIKTGDELVAIVSDTELGKKIRIEYMRDKKLASTQVEVGDRNKIVAEARPASAGEEERPSGEPVGGGILGLSVRNLTHDQAQEVSSQLHLKSAQGVLVVDARADGFASELGLQRGDVILSVNQQPVASVDDFNRVQATLKSGSDVVFLVARHAQETFSTLFLADRLP